MKCRSNIEKDKRPLAILLRGSFVLKRQILIKLKKFLSCFQKNYIKRSCYMRGVNIQLYGYYKKGGKEITAITVGRKINTYRRKQNGG